MKLPLTTAQIKDIEYFQKTYLGTSKGIDETKAILKNHVTSKDLAVINKKEKLFPRTKLERHYKKGVDHTLNQFNMINFFMANLPASYRLKLTTSAQIHNFIRTLLQVDSPYIQDKNSKEDQISFQFASQMLMYSLTTMIQSMPPEFQTELRDSLLPFVRQVTALNYYAKRHGLKDIPTINVPDMFYPS